jgi:ABC-type amino acid transport substrate-binding protein
MRHRVLLVLLAAFTLLTVACGQESEAPDTAATELGETTLDKCVINQGETAPAAGDGGEFETLKSGTLTVGSDTAFPPFESIENGESVGFDVDLIKEVAKRLELGAEIQSAAFDTIFTSLAAKKFDVVVSAVTIKEERKQTVDFTDSYFTADLSVSVRDVDAESISGVDDLAGKTIGVQATTTSEDCGKTLKEDGEVGDIRAYDTIPDAFTDLAAGRVAAVMIDLPTAQQIVEQRKGLRVVEVIKTQEEYGIAVAKDNPNLRVAINDALKEIRDDGTYTRLFVKWFKTEPPE